MAVAYSCDVDEAGCHLVPTYDEWGKWLEPFKQTSLKTVGMSIWKGQGDEEICSLCPTICFYHFEKNITL